MDKNTGSAPMPSGMHDLDGEEISTTVTENKQQLQPAYRKDNNGMITMVDEPKLQPEWEKRFTEASAFWLIKGESGNQRLDFYETRTNTSPLDTSE